MIIDYTYPASHWICGVSCFFWGEYTRREIENAPHDASVIGKSASTRLVVEKKKAHRKSPSTRLEVERERKAHRPLTPAILWQVFFIFKERLVSCTLHYGRDRVSVAYP